LSAAHVSSTTHIPPHVGIGQILRLSLYYGVAGFGGGYSVLAQLRRDLVERRRWMTSDEFLVLAELSKSLPGTPATSLLALLGQKVGGLKGGLVAAVAFLVPSGALMIACGAAYPLMRKLQGLSIFFDGMNAAMVGVVGAVTLDLARSALRTWRDGAAAVGCAALLSLRIVSEPVLAVAAVAIGAVRGALAGRVGGQRPTGREDEPPKSERLHGLGWPALLGGFGVGAATPGLLAALVRVFVPIGVMTFGGGLAMIPAIEHMVVAEQGWLDSKAFADAIALGQITPGPVAICATFIGYRVARIPGALVASAAIFGPAIAVALAAGHSVERFRRSPLVEGALRALAPAVIGMLLAATVSLGRAGLHGGIDVGVGVITFLLLCRFPVSPLWPLLGGGVLQVAATMLMRSL
jgi:chromate transporter